MTVSEALDLLSRQISALSSQWCDPELATIPSWAEVSLFLKITTELKFDMRSKREPVQASEMME